MLSILFAGTAAAQTCAIVAAESNGSRINVKVHTTHVGPPFQMKTTLSTSGGWSSGAQAPVSVYYSINVYTFTIPTGSATFSATVRTGVGTSCATGSVTVGANQSYATNSFAWADITGTTINGQARCDLRIALYSGLTWYLWGAPVARFSSGSDGYGTWNWTEWLGYGSCPNPFYFTIPGDPLGGVTYKVSSQYGQF